MKKLLYLFLAVTIFACSSDDNDNTNNNNSNSSNNVSINPPSWIQGVWVNEEILLLAGVRTGYEFKVDDLCLITNNMANCNKNTLVSFGAYENGLLVDVQEEISANRYAIDITIQSSTTSYIFEKIDNNNIIHKGVGGQVIDNVLIRE